MSIQNYILIHADNKTLLKNERYLIIAFLAILHCDLIYFKSKKVETCSPIL